MRSKRIVYFQNTAIRIPKLQTANMREKNTTFM